MLAGHDAEIQFAENELRVLMVVLVLISGARDHVAKPNGSHAD